MTNPPATPDRSIRAGQPGAGVPLQPAAVWPVAAGPSTAWALRRPSAVWSKGRARAPPSCSPPQGQRLREPGSPAGIPGRRDRAGTHRSPAHPAVPTRRNPPTPQPGARPATPEDGAAGVFLVIGAIFLARILSAWSPGGSTGTRTRPTRSSPATAGTRRQHSSDRR